MTHTLTVARPSGGETLVFGSAPNGTVNLPFDPAEATASRAENSLVFTFGHGGKIVLNGFFAVGDEKLPDLALPDGNVVATTDFFAGSNLDLSTAAGPYSSSSPVTSSGVGEYGDSAGDLLSGVDRLGSLGTHYWNRSAGTADTVQSAFAAEDETGSASVPESSVREPEASISYDERFVVTRDSAPVTFGHVLHNDGAADAAIIGVRDADGNFYSLAELAALGDLNGGLGLETEYGWLRVDGDTLVFEAKPGMDASAEEVITYVARNNVTGEEYTQNVQIRFSDDDNNFSSSETIDTYYSQNTAGHEMAGIALGAGQDRIIVIGKHAEDTGKTIDAGDGHNYIELDSGDTASANRHASLSVEAGSGNDTIVMSGYAQAASHSTVTIDSGDGKDIIELYSGSHMAAYHGEIEIAAGAGANAILLDADTRIASDDSKVTVTSGNDNDVIKLYANLDTEQETDALAAHRSSVTINAGDGENTVDLKAGYRLVNDASDMVVNTGKDDDTITLSSGHAMAIDGSTLTVNAGGGHNVIDLDAGKQIAYGNSTVAINAAGGNDTITLTSEKELHAVAELSASVIIDAGAGDNEITLESLSAIAVDDSRVTVTADTGNDTISLVSDGGHLIRTGSTLEVHAGDGLNSVELQATNHLAVDHSEINVTSGAGADLVNITSGNRGVSDYSTLTVDTGEGNDTINVSVTETHGGHYLASDDSHVQINAGGGHDSISIQADELFFRGSARVEGGDGNDTISLDMREVNAGTMFLNGGDGDDLLEVLGGNMSNQRWSGWFEASADSEAEYTSFAEGVVLTGGSGADIFSFGGSATHSLAGEAIITDFSLTEGDTLHFRNLLPDDAEDSLDSYLSVLSDAASGDVTLQVNTGGGESFSVRFDGALNDGGSLAGLNESEIMAALFEQIVITNS